MSLLDRYATLPTRLQAAMRIWLGLGLISALTPASATTSVGVLAQPWFWLLLLPVMALLPYRRTLLPAKREAGARRVRNVAQRARRTPAPALMTLAGQNAA